MEEVLLKKPSIEYVDGKAYFKAVSPRTKHLIVQGAALCILHRCSAGMGIAGTEWDFRVGILDGTQTMLVPDVAVVMLSRLRALPEDECAAALRTGCRRGGPIAVVPLSRRCLSTL